MRVTTLACAVVFGTVFGLYLFWRAGEWALDRFVYENSAFAIQKIEVQSNGVIGPDQVCRWAGVTPGENLIALDLAAVKRNLELVPAIQTVSIERILPRTLKIRVTERNPVAQVNVPHADGANGITVSVFQLDASGVVMLPLDPRRCTVPLARLHSRLPVISGLNIYQLQPGHRVELPQALAALQLISAFNHSPMAGLADLRRVDVSAPGVIVATTGNGGEITFGLDHFEQQLGRWREIYDLGRRMNKAIASLNLAVSNNVPVRWMEITTAPVVGRQNAVPVNSWRKNV